MAFVKVFSGSVVEVEHVKQVLQQNGIEPVIKDNAGSATMAGFGVLTPGFQELWVHSDQVSAVQKLISSL